MGVGVCVVWKVLESGAVWLCGRVWRSHRWENWKVEGGGGQWPYTMWPTISMVLEDRSLLLPLVGKSAEGRASVG